jgi:hypothetical protein
MLSGCLHFLKPDRVIRQCANRRFLLRYEFIVATGGALCLMQETFFT